MSTKARSFRESTGRSYASKSRPRTAEALQVANILQTFILAVMCNHALGTSQLKLALQISALMTRDAPPPSPCGIKQTSWLKPAV